ncbi:hypothetical protein RchiOBHm_Chr6g0246471 [Rosa chinensis]|uniref:Uncharacterized protein n=1 Tax=Rosa chinensis TaxID=74649 RepID=A0A2P6PJJ0_ROSCH|nr:hypothetical protein RchiOBHm_Chr6g0246471 [Rosa chinensis]
MKAPSPIAGSLANPTPKANHSVVIADKASRKTYFNKSLWPG